MKLGALKAALREHRGDIRTWMNMPSSPPCAVTVVLAKGALLDSLDEAYPGGRSQETGLEFVRGFLKRIGDDIVIPED